MILITLWLGKLVLWLLKRLGRTGSALPGLIAERLYPNFLPRMLAKLPRGVVLVSGTNGKTTTTKLIADLLSAQGVKVLTNQTGSNFERGVSSTLIGKAKLSGKLPYDVAVLELDEAHAARFVQRVSPVGLVALNIMRDQMDRYGEIDHTTKLLTEIASKTTGWLVLNANDPRISQLQQAGKGKQTVWFGYNKSLAKSFVTDDQLYHQDDLKFFMAHQPDVELVSDINKLGQFSVSFDGQVQELSTKLEGSHNALNISAALASLQLITPDISMAEVAKTLPTIAPAFGRGELIQLKAGGSLRLQLIKNPGSFSYGLHALTSQSKPAVVGIAINDNYADSRDVSWLWDVQFDALQGLPPAICGGSRGYDMAVRLKYDGLDVGAVNLPLDKFLSSCIRAASKRPAVIFCTYTAMLSLRKSLLALGQIERVDV